MQTLLLENGALDTMAIRRRLEEGAHVALGRLHAVAGFDGNCRVWRESDHLFLPDQTILHSVSPDEAALYIAQCFDSLLLSGVRLEQIPRPNVWSEVKT